MALELEVEFLLGVGFLAKQPASDEPDWPPQPDRVFSALVAAWGTRGKRAEERAALEWLEAQEPPRILASEAWQRPAPTVYVPPNDPRSGRVGNLDVLPERRSRQARRFPAALLDDPLVHYLWPEATPDEGTLGALDALARDVACVGHSASLTRCRFRARGVEADEAPGRQALRRVYPGRLAELCAAFPERRPNLGATVRRTPAPEEGARSVFGERWIVLEHTEGPIPDLRASAIVAKRLREAIMAGFDSEPIPEILSGHSADGAPSPDPHLAIVPLAFLGHPHADGGVHGFALVLPRAHEEALDAVYQGRPTEASDAALDLERRLAEALARITRPEKDRDRSVLTLYMKPGADQHACAELRFAFGGLGSGKSSIDPARYLRAETFWVTATPIVLDRHLKMPARAATRGDAEARQDEIAELIGKACENIGLPRPSKVVPDKHSAIAGAPSAHPSGKAPPWTGWRVPEAYRTRGLIHATLVFDEPVKGPLVLGAARHLGLGLCLPLDRRRRR